MPVSLRAELMPANASSMPRTWVSARSDASTSDLLGQRVTSPSSADGRDVNELNSFALVTASIAGGSLDLRRSVAA